MNTHFPVQRLSEIFVSYETMMEVCYDDAATVLTTDSEEFAEMFNDSRHDRCERQAEFSEDALAVIGERFIDTRDGNLNWVFDSLIISVLNDEDEDMFNLMDNSVVGQFFRQFKVEVDFRDVIVENAIHCMTQRGCAVDFESELDDIAHNFLNGKSGIINKYIAATKVSELFMNEWNVLQYFIKKFGTKDAGLYAQSQAMSDF